MLLRGGEPIAGLSDDEIIARKISDGSYATLVGQESVSLRFMEPLRGLLCDDPRERWTFADLEMWVGGRQLSPKQPMVPGKAARAIAPGRQGILESTGAIPRHGMQLARGRQAHRRRRIGELGPAHPLPVEDRQVPGQDSCVLAGRVGG